MRPPVEARLYARTFGAVPAGAGIGRNWPGGPCIACASVPATGSAGRAYRVRRGALGRLFSRRGGRCPSSDRWAWARGPTGRAGSGFETLGRAWASGRGAAGPCAIWAPGCLASRRSRARNWAAGISRPAVAVRPAPVPRPDGEPAWPRGGPGKFAVGAGTGRAVMSTPGSAGTGPATVVEGSGRGAAASRGGSAEDGSGLGEAGGAAARTPGSPGGGLAVFFPPFGGGGASAPDGSGLPGAAARRSGGAGVSDGGFVAATSGPAGSPAGLAGFAEGGATAGAGGGEAETAGACATFRAPSERVSVAGAGGCGHPCERRRKVDPAAARPIPQIATAA